MSIEDILLHSSWGCVTQLFTRFCLILISTNNNLKSSSILILLYKKISFAKTNIMLRVVLKNTESFLRYIHMFTIITPIYYHVNFDSYCSIFLWLFCVYKTNLNMGLWQQHPGAIHAPCVWLICVCARGAKLDCINSEWISCSFSELTCFVYLFCFFVVHEIRNRV